MKKVKLFFLLIGHIIIHQQSWSQNTFKKVLFIGDINTFQQLEKLPQLNHDGFYKFYYRHQNVNWQTDFESLEFQYQKQKKDVQMEMPEKFDIVILGTGLNSFMAQPKEKLITSISLFGRVLEKDGTIIIENVRMLDEQYPKVYCSPDIIVHDNKMDCSDTIKTQEKLIEQINDKELAILKSRTDIIFLPIRQILLINNESKLINSLEYPQKGLLRSDGYVILGNAYYALISGKGIDNLKFSGNTEQTESIKKVLKLAFEKK